MTWINREYHIHCTEIGYTQWDLREEIMYVCENFYFAP